MLFHEAQDALNDIEPDGEEFTVDQKLKIAQIKALLSISQELSQIHHQGINPQFDA